jgi:hypothetical protein
MATRTKLRSLKNIDFSDRELLHVLSDVADDDGWATTPELGQTLGIVAPETMVTPNQKIAYVHRCVGARYAFMKRAGWVERDETRTKWRITRIGRDLMMGNLSKALENSLGKLKPGDRVLVMRSLTQAYRADRVESATMLRREWQHGAQRNGRNGSR